MEKVIIFFAYSLKKDTFYCIIKLPNPNTKEGVLNEKLALGKLLTYISSVYNIPQKIKGLTDYRKRKTIPFFNIIMPVFLSLTLQYESFHAVFSSPESMQRRLKHIVRGRIPGADAVRDALTLTDPAEIRQIHESVIDRIRRNRVFSGGTIGGYTVVALDGVELFGSTKKSCPECLTRKLKTGETEYFHRSVVCMSVGRHPHVVIGQEMLRPRDGSDKDEGELTGGKRLLERLKKRHGHFADVVVADALYLNAPFVNTVLNNGMDVVIRMKDERRQLLKDAKGLFEKGYGKRAGFQSGKMKVEVWDEGGFRMEGVKKEVRVLKYLETWEEKGKQQMREVWLMTTLEQADCRTLWKMMHKRWDIEENGFHQLKTYYHAKHCYCHGAAEVIFQLMLLAFNMREMYLYRRVRGFHESRMTRKSINRKWRDDLLLEKVYRIWQEEGG